MVIRKEKITNYTKIDNNYLEDKNISLKAKGLLSYMLSLPDDWDYFQVLLQFVKKVLKQ